MNTPHRPLDSIFFTCLIAVILLLSTPIAECQITINHLDQNGWRQVLSDQVNPNQRIDLQASSNFESWNTVGVFHGAFIFTDPNTEQFSQRFYRFLMNPLGEEDDWKNQVTLTDPFRRTDGAAYGWIKFAIPIPGFDRVYYANRDYIFHYDFVTTRLPPHIGISPFEFDRITRFNADRELMLGTLLIPSSREFGIQFVSRDPIPAPLVSDLFRLVESTVVVPHDAQAFYIPSFEQAGTVATNAGYFEAQGISVTSSERWTGNEVCYSEGWALGTLKFFGADQVEEAYLSGALTPDDILITDGIPAELPFLSGIISLAPTTPNSHVALLARSYGVPFVYLGEPDRQAHALQLTNREIVFQASRVHTLGTCAALILPVDPPIDPGFLDELQATRPTTRIEVQPKETYGNYAASADNLVPDDIRYFGGKASNFGLLRRVIPSNSPPAIAFSFDLWDEFMSQSHSNGNTLRQEISNRLANFTYPPNVNAVVTELDEIRDIIRDETVFSPELEQTIMAALAPFDPTRKIRFRSSTNVEDAETFSGAGLYDSFSGCLLDDLDGDANGPSICDPDKENERGVFRAIRKVYASFYNDTAFLERLRLGVNESEVGMALLVHHSTPDEIEWANGVGTGIRSSTFYGTLVSQIGAVSVANPDGSTTPEEVSFVASRGSPTRLDLDKSSSLLRLGETVMTWDEDYIDLVNLFMTVAEGYDALLSEPRGAELDIEYKKIAPGFLQIKQVREVPSVPRTKLPPFVLNNPATTFAAWHGFYDDIFMAHRLKSRWTLRNRNMPFTAENLTNGFYTELTIEHLNGTNVQALHGDITSFPNFSQTVVDGDSGYIVNNWDMSTGGGAARFTLRTVFDGNRQSTGPFTAPAEEGSQSFDLDVAFNEPLLAISPFGVIDPNRTNAISRLYPLVSEVSGDYFETVSWNIPGQGTNVLVETSYWLGAVARREDCHCPILRFVETRIEGLTSDPIILTSYWSQTFNAIHISDHQQFIFEPRLDPGVSPSQLTELADADIAQIYVNGYGYHPEVLYIIGLDGTPRRFSDQDFNSR